MEQQGIHGIHRMNTGRDILFHASITSLHKPLANNIEITQSSRIASW